MPEVLFTHEHVTVSIFLSFPIGTIRVSVKVNGECVLPSPNVDNKYLKLFMLRLPASVATGAEPFGEGSEMSQIISSENQSGLPEFRLICTNSISINNNIVWFLLLKRLDLLLLSVYVAL